MYEGDMTECFPINETLLHSVQFENKIYDTAPQCLRNSSAVMLCTYAYMDFATRMLLRQAPRASLKRLLSILLVLAVWSHWHSANDVDLALSDITIFISPEARSNQQPAHAMHRSLGEVAAEGQVDPSQTDEEPLYLQALVALLLTCQQWVVELQVVVDAAELLLF